MATLRTQYQFSHATAALQQAWTTEIVQAMLAVGLTQTSDTGQMANPCTTVFGGGASTAYGYYMFGFNDTLQATSPIYIKLEAGNSANPVYPMMWITVGTGTNGADTVTGTVMTRVACFGQSTLPTTFWPLSHYCYSAPQGFLGFDFKQSAGTSNTSYGGFILYRSVNNVGLPTADSIHMITNSNTPTANTTYGYLQLINHNNNTAYNSSGPVADGRAWCPAPFGFASIAELTGGYQVYPLYQYIGTASAPGYGMTNAAAMSVTADIAMGQTMSFNILGTAHKYLSTGNPFGVSSGMSNPVLVSPTYSLMMLWE